MRPDCPYCGSPDAMDSDITYLNVDGGIDYDTILVQWECEVCKDHWTRRYNLHHEEGE